MRALTLALLFVFAGCDSGDAARGPDPAPAAGGGASGGAATPDGGDSECVKKCVDSRAMEARSPDDIKRDCEKECAGK